MGAYGIYVKYYNYVKEGVFYFDTHPIKTTYF
nr:MAG TPA: hypothetical protein [Caudoviricetes sp.]